MANRRMFSLDIVASDAFLEMPTSSRELYFHLGMYADDDGFVSPKKIMRMVGATEDDLKILLAKRFLIVFENGVVVIKHWKMNNYIKNDRYKETVYVEEKKALITKDNGSYTECIQNVSKLETQVRLGKVRLGKVSIDNSRFAPPNIEEVKKYCDERQNSVDPQTFVDHYEANGWFRGKTKIKNWQACVRTWEKSSQSKGILILKD